MNNKQRLELAMQTIVESKEDLFKIFEMVHKNKELFSKEIEPVFVHVEMAYLKLKYCEENLMDM